MAITAVQTVVAQNTSTTPTATVLAPTSGNLLVVHLQVNGGGSVITAANGFAKAANTEVTSGDTGVHLFKVAGASEGTSLAPATLDGSVGWLLHVTEYSVDGSKAWSYDSSNGVIDNAGSVKTTPAVTPTSGKEALVFCSAGGTTASQGPYSSEDVNGSTTGVTERTDVGALGTAACTYDLFVASTSGSYQGNATATGSGNGTAHIAIYTATASGVAPRRLLLLGAGQ